MNSSNQQRRGGSYCSHCGKPLEIHARFCEYCGTQAEPLLTVPVPSSTSAQKNKYRQLSIAITCILFVLVILLGRTITLQNRSESKVPEQLSSNPNQTALPNQPSNETVSDAEENLWETGYQENGSQDTPPIKDSIPSSISQKSVNMLRASPEGEILFGVANPNSIAVVSFQSTLNGLPSLAYDVSQNRDGSVMAWVSGSEMIIAADGVITAPKDCSWMFAYAHVQAINFNGCLDTSNVTNMERMFLYCSCLEYLDLSSFDTGNVTTMESMFERCVSLTELNVTGFDTSRVTDMNHMFFVCISLKRLDLSSFHTDSVRNTQSMFSNCTTLTKVDLSNFDTKYVTDLRWMFYKCPRLSQIVISSFNMASAQTTGGMFDGCEQLDVSTITFISN